MLGATERARRRSGATPHKRAREQRRRCPFFSDRSVAKSIAELPAAIGRIIETRRGAMAPDAQVLDAEPVPEADLDEVREREGVAVLARDRRTVVVVDAEEIVARRHAMPAIVEGEQRVDGAERAVEVV